MDKNLRMISKDVEYLIVLGKSEQAKKRVAIALYKIATILYAALQVEMGLAGILLPARMDLVCKTCRRYDPKTSRGNKGPICPRCDAKIKPIVSPYNYEIVLEHNGVKKAAGTTQVIGTARGETISDAVANFATFVISRKYDIFRPVGTDPVYENVAGEKVYMREIKRKVKK